MQENLQPNEAIVLAESHGEKHRHRPGFRLLADFVIVQAGTKVEMHLLGLLRDDLPLLLETNQQIMPGDLLTITRHESLIQSNAFMVERVEKTDISPSV